MTITIDSAAEFLNLHSHTFAPQIRTQLLEGLEVENMLSPALSDGEYYAAERAVAGEILQPYQGGYTPKGSITHSENTIRVRPIKVDMDWTETDLKKWWDSYRASRFEAGIDPLTWTFPKYIMERVLIPKMYSDMNNVAWNGVYAAPTTGTPGAAVDSVNGFKKVIADLVTDSKINVVASGTFTATEIRENLELFMDSIPEHIVSRGGKILLSAGNRRKYVRDYRGEFYQNNTGIHANNNAPRSVMLDDYDVELVGIRSMGASNRFIFVPNEAEPNMRFVSRNGYAMYPEFIFKSSNPRILHMSATIYRGYGFEDPANIYVSNQV